MIDTTHAHEGTVSATWVGEGRCKLVVSKGGRSEHYDVGAGVTAPLSLGSGRYSLRLMRQVSGNRYVEVEHAALEVALDAFAPWLSFSSIVPEGRRAAALARQLREPLAIVQWVTAHVAYDRRKAALLAGRSGYRSDPDATLAAGTGVCLDHAVLCASMLRSAGVPARLVTGRIQPRDAAHAWVQAWVGGCWRRADPTLGKESAQIYRAEHLY